MSDELTLDSFAKRLPPSDEVERRIGENLRERQFLQRLLKLSREHEAIRSPDAKGDRR